MPKPKTQKNQFLSATPVSYRLQFTTVAVVLSGAIVNLWYFIPMFANAPNGPNSSYFFASIIQSFLFPILVFALAYVSSPRYTAPIGRWFIATVKSVIVTGIYGILYSLWTHVTIESAQLAGNTVVPAAWWISSNIPQYILMGITVAGMLMYIYLQGKRNN